MFTGIIEARGIITAIMTQQRFVRLKIGGDLDLQDVRLGDSIAVDGACLTVTTLNPSAGEFTADVSPETLGVTTLGEFKPGRHVNLEKALRLDSRLGGHLVTGHIDCVGLMTEKKTVGEGSLLGFTVDSGRYLIEKGSVAVDGVSLTVNKVIDNAFRVMIIPQTSIWTGLTQKNVNDKVNIEFDLIGKYIEKFVSSSTNRTSVTEETLLRHGFI